MSTPIRVAVVDDHLLVRKSMSALLANWPRGSVVLEAANGKEFVQACEAGAEVDVAVVDLTMTVMDGFETIAWVRDHRPGIRTLALSFDMSPERGARAVQAGAGGLLSKDHEPRDLLTGIEQLVDMGHYHNALIDAQRTVKPGTSPSEQWPDLTQREWQMLFLVCWHEYMQDKEVAQELGMVGIPSRTIATSR